MDFLFIAVPFDSRVHLSLLRSGVYGDVSENSEASDEE